MLTLEYCSSCVDRLYMLHLPMNEKITNWRLSTSFLSKQVVLNLNSKRYESDVFKTVVFLTSSLKRYIQHNYNQCSWLVRRHNLWFWNVMYNDTANLFSSFLRLYLNILKKCGILPKWQLSTSVDQTHINNCGSQYIFVRPTTMHKTILRS